MSLKQEMETTYRFMQKQGFWKQAKPYPKGDWSSVPAKRPAGPFNGSGASGSWGDSPASKGPIPTLPDIPNDESRWHQAGQAFAAAAPAAVTTAGPTRGMSLALPAAAAGTTLLLGTNKGRSVVNKGIEHVNNAINKQRAYTGLAGTLLSMPIRNAWNYMTGANRSVMDAPGAWNRHTNTSVAVPQQYGTYAASDSGSGSDSSSSSKHRSRRRNPRNDNDNNGSWLSFLKGVATLGTGELIAGGWDPISKPLSEGYYKWNHGGERPVPESAYNTALKGAGGLQSEYGRKADFRRRNPGINFTGTEEQQFLQTQPTLPPVNFNGGANGVSRQQEGATESNNNQRFIRDPNTGKLIENPNYK